MANPKNVRHALQLVMGLYITTSGFVFGAALGESSTAILTITDNATEPPVRNPTWVSTGKLNTARYFHTATLLPGGKVLVAGGYAGPSVLSTNSAELYDPETSIWSVTGSLFTPLVFHTATLLANGKVLVAGGNTSFAPPSFGVTGSSALYDASTGTWSNTGSLNGATNSHTATLLHNGKVLIAGGWGENLP
jgi:Kelch motif